jgi:hypothetical protein
VIIALNYAATLGATAANVSLNVTLLKESLPSGLQGVGTCSKVITDVGDKFLKFESETKKEIAAIDNQWPGGSGSMVIVVTTKNCPLDITDADILDVFAEGHSYLSGGAGGGGAQAARSTTTSHSSSWAGWTSRIRPTLRIRR